MSFLCFFILLQKSQKAQQLLAQASKALAESISLCLQHNLSSSILAGASLNMLECHGQSDPAVAGQYLALLQVHAKYIPTVFCKDDVCVLRFCLCLLMMFFNKNTYGNSLRLTALSSTRLLYSQSCRTVAVMAEVLNSACADTSASQLSALLSIRRNLLLSLEERPSSMIREVEDSLSSLSKVAGHQTPILMIYGFCHTQLSKFP